LDQFHPPSIFRVTPALLRPCIRPCPSPPAKATTARPTFSSASAPLNAALGPLRISATKAETRDLIPQVQRWLISLMGELATPPGLEAKYAATHKDLISAEQVGFLDTLAAKLEASGALQFKGWALPGEAGVMSGAFADLARVACRRAERSVIDLVDTPQDVPNREVARFLNRLSDVLWLIARWEERQEA
jgi:cob(I)alamin adenosyltransferase